MGVPWRGRCDLIAMGFNADAIIGGSRYTALLIGCYVSLELLYCGCGDGLYHGGRERGVPPTTICIGAINQALAIGRLHQPQIKETYVPGELEVEIRHKLTAPPPFRRAGFKSRILT